MQSWTQRADALHDLAKKARAAFEGAAVMPLSGVSAQKFVTQVAVAMLDVYEIKTQLPGHKSGSMKVFDDGCNFSVGEQRVVGRQFQAMVEKWMVIENAWFRAGMLIGAAVPAGMRQLQTDDQTIVRTSCQNMLVS